MNNSEQVSIKGVKGEATDRFGDPRFPDCFIHPMASVEGLVEMGVDCSVWPGAVIRADMNTVRLGRGVNIQDNSTLHVDSGRGLSIGDYTLVGHNTMLHSCTIGRACLIGIGSVILDGAEIGDGAMITAGCLIRGGKKIPPGALVLEKNGKQTIVENKAKTRYAVTGSIEYINLARRHREGIWGPFTKEEERGFYEQAGVLLSEMGIMVR